LNKVKLRGPEEEGDEVAEEEGEVLRSVTGLEVKEDDWFKVW
jgi:hypothetical protein